MTTMRTHAFWTDDAPRPGDLPVSADLGGPVDVAIVGAGLTGLNAARRLAMRGASVAVLDAGSVGAGASTVNGGQINYGLKASTKDVYKRYGQTMGRTFWDASLASIDHVAAVVAEDSLDCDFTRPGAAELGHHARDLGSFHEEAEWMARHLDFSVEVVGPDRIESVVRSPEYHCAIVDSVGASLHPARYVWSLARAVADRGVRLVEQARVSSVDRAGSRHRLTTAKGHLDAGEVIWATNGYTGDELGDLRRRIIPVGSYIVATAPLERELAESLIPQRRAMWTARRFLNYFRRSPDDRILMGGRNNLSTGLDLHESARTLRTTVSKVFPELADVPVTHSWTGRLAVTFDLMPHIGRIDGVWYALGYGGHGVGIGSYVGDEVGKLVGGEIDSSPFAEIDHPTRWFHRGDPWFLPFAAVWYRLLDRLGR